MQTARCRRSFPFLPALLLLAAIVPATADARGFPILLYHRFGPQVNSSTMVRTDVFEAQLVEIERNGCRVVPLAQLVRHIVGQGPPPATCAIAVTVDDGHRSVYTQLLPVVLRHRVPVTLFIYPSAISNAPYGLTWQQLRELHATGLFDIQSHTYWHPNFKREKRRLGAEAYRRLVEMQLGKAREILEQHIGAPVDMLAWPFGIYDRELEEHAWQAGYVAAFTMEGSPARSGDDPMAIPRYYITSATGSRAFAAIVAAAKERP